MTRLRTALFTASLALLFAVSASPTPVHAQDWQQEIQIVTTIPYDDPLHVFLDSLASIFDRNPEVPLRRSVDDDAPVPYRVLRDSLYDEGLDLRSASHVLIRYQFNLSAQGTGVVETIKDLYFIFRLDEAREDLPILYLSTADPLVSSLLLDRGISSTMNLMSFTPFRQHMAFPVLHGQNRTEVVELGRRALRDDLAPRQRQLVALLNEQMGFGPGSYQLSTMYQQKQDARSTTRVAADTTLFR
jgi:hypothetical protein